MDVSNPELPVNIQCYTLQKTPPKKQEQASSPETLNHRFHLSEEFLTHT